MNTPELAWFKSSYSSGGDGDCVEVALSWHKSSYSSGGSGDCVEVASCADTVHIRDSKDAQGARLDVPPRSWDAFVSYAAQS